MSKKSNAEIELEAKEYSLKHPDTVYYVIAKKRYQAQVYSIPWMAIQKINYDNFYPLCRYKNGVRYN